jgi:hypothetical protein
MRRIFLILMIALLPLRSWAGDIMAMEMTMQHVIAINFIAISPDNTGASGLFYAHKAASTGAECPGHTAMGFAPAPAAADPAYTPSDGHCSTCGVCQICHTVALAQATVWLAPAFIAPTLVPIGGTRFTSALPALGLKPPIS